MKREDSLEAIATVVGGQLARKLLEIGFDYDEEQVLLQAKAAVECLVQAMAMNEYLLSTGSLRAPIIWEVRGE